MNGCKPSFLLSMCFKGTVVLPREAYSLIHSFAYCLNTSSCNMMDNGILHELCMQQNWVIKYYHLDAKQRVRFEDCLGKL